MKFPVSLLCSCLLACSSLGGSETYKVFASKEFRETRQVSVALRLRADFVGVPVTISSDQKDPEQRSNEIRLVKESIIQRAKGNPNLSIHQGSSSLSVETGGSFSKFGAPSSQTVLSIIVQLSKDQNDVYGCVSEVNRLISMLQLPGKASVSLGRALLGVNNPESYRQKLLHLIAQDSKATKEALGARAHVSIGGLHQMVLVRQIDETDVELFIPYTFSFDFTE